MRRTARQLTVAAQLVEDPHRSYYGLELCRLTELPSGLLHPMLARWRANGWLTDEWENIHPGEAGRPLRRYWKLTDDGVRALTEYVKGARDRLGT